MTMGNLGEITRGNRIHIIICGRRNVGKSTLMNSLTGQNIAIVSDVAGTTTDPIYKSMEFSFGAGVLVDTAGLDDGGELGELRKEKSQKILRKADILILLVNSEEKNLSWEKNFLEKIKLNNNKILAIINKRNNEIVDLKKWEDELGIKCLDLDVKNKTEMNKLHKKLAKILKNFEPKKNLLAGLLEGIDFILMVVPLDAASPKNRLILPQMQVLREALEREALVLVSGISKLTKAFSLFPLEKTLIITDSQAFEEVCSLVPLKSKLTSFSILLAKSFGQLDILAKGIKGVENLKSFDKILIVEACTHHPLSQDIGRVKIPLWLQKNAQIPLAFDWIRGQDFPDNLEDYKLIIHCGACMLNKEEMDYRLKKAQNLKIPIINYGILIAYLKGYWDRVAWIKDLD